VASVGGGQGAMSCSQSRIIRSSSNKGKEVVRVRTRLIGGVYGF